MAKIASADWLAEMHRIASRGDLTYEDEFHMLEMMRMPNDDDVPVEDVVFRRHRSHF